LGELYPFNALQASPTVGNAHVSGVNGRAAVRQEVVTAKERPAGTRVCRQAEAKPRVVAAKV